MEKIHINEWRKKYSPKDEIISFTEIAGKMDLDPRVFNVTKKRLGDYFVDKPKPEFFRGK
jgi:5-bromo-4-chloroindolyl phosphate hydrolysis protein